ncbi:hypothetical protein L596_020540 [Steinernema carpocapsae]|uniref:Uncharacterized protein n=1 Tax=Steinernema carpocapsae TaxID=34508 RepID=A0A4U5MUI0_STECR|nr:hypothetical protein L596_020540 [Steinernema carpocapsae]
MGTFETTIAADATVGTLTLCLEIGLRYTIGDIHQNGLRFSGKPEQSVIVGTLTLCLEIGLRYTIGDGKDILQHRSVVDDNDCVQRLESFKCFQLVYKMRPSEEMRQKIKHHLRQHFNSNIDDTMRTTRFVKIFLGILGAVVNTSEVQTIKVFKPKLLPCFASVQYLLTED